MSTSLWLTLFVWGFILGGVILYVRNTMNDWRPDDYRCNNEHKSKWWMRLLCMVGIHWHGRSDGGGMGDAYQCHVCKRDNYFPCILIHDEAGDRDWDALVTVFGIILVMLVFLAGFSVLAITIWRNV